MATCIAVVRCDIDPEVEDQFNDFYNSKHLQVALRTPGFKSAQRFRLLKHVDTGEWNHPLAEEFNSPAPEQRYIAVYELETPELVSNLSDHPENRASTDEFLEWADKLRNVSISFYEAISEVKRPGDD